ncbi:hypothetical protein G7Y79_00013g034300 [Physcia stellaris]|nr:hypothetical protein G7Y79_00013g034300 [Physcia stellaris]
MGLPSATATSSGNMTDKQPPRELFKSRFDVPYSDLSALNTVDLHFPTNPAPDFQKSNIWLIYIHGGAFRDPGKTSRSILPSLPHLFSPSSPYRQPFIHGVASLNHRLSPYPTHPTNPSKPGDPARSSKWPDHMNDVKAGIAWVLNQGDDSQENTKPDSGRDGIFKRRYILAGHSVGGTMAMLIAQSDPAELAIPLPLGIVPLCGIYNFTALRDAHPANADIYNTFTTAAFGPEDEGGWERGNCTKGVIHDEVRVVVMGHGKRDTLVEWGQVEEMAGVMDRVNEGISGGGGIRKARVIEVKGDHDEVWEGGVEVAGCVDVAMKTLGVIRGLDSIRDRKSGAF